MRIAILILLLSSNIYAQNLYRFSKKAGSLKVQRTVTVNRINENLARRVLSGKIQEQVRHDRITLRATQRIAARQPHAFVGSNNYLKGLSRQFVGRPGWTDVFKSGGYNGAHHIVTKSVLKQLGYGPETLNNAPSVFHPLHNNKNFELTFHDHTTQMELYKKYGIQGVIIDFFERINAINMALGMPEYTPEQVQQELNEGHLWAKHWGLKWD